jgi:hypothetical protein
VRKTRFNYLFAAIVLQQLRSTGVDTEAAGASEALTPQSTSGEAMTCLGPGGHRNAGGAALAHPLGQTSTNQQKTQLPTLLAVKATLAKKSTNKRLVTQNPYVCKKILLTTLPSPSELDVDDVGWQYKWSDLKKLWKS